MLEATLDIAMTGDPMAPAAGDWVAVGLIESGECRMGRDPATGQPRPGTAVFEVLDQARDLDPNNPGGLYAGQIEEQRPVRVKARDTAAGWGPVNVWQGWLAPQGVRSVDFGHTGHRAVLTAVDALGQAGSLQLPASAMRAVVRAGKFLMFVATPGGLNPVQSYFPAAEFDAAAGVVDEGPGALAGGNFSHTPIPGGPAVNGDEGAFAWRLNGTSNYVALPADSSARLPFSIGFWIGGIQPRAGTSFRTIYAQYDGGGNLGLRIRVNDTGTGNPGELVVDFQGAAWSQVWVCNASALITTIPRLDDGEAHYVQVNAWVTGGVLSVRFSIDGQRQSESAFTVFGTPTTIYRVVGVGAQLVGIDNGAANGYLGASIQDLLILNGATYLPTSELNMAALARQVWGSNPAANFYPDDRVRVVLDVVGWPAALRDVPGRGAGSLYSKPITHTDYSPKGPALDELLEAADIEGGAIRATKDGKLRLAGFTAAPIGPLATWDDGTSGVAGALPYEDVELDRTTVVNRWTVTQDGGACVFGPDGITVASTRGAPAVAEDAATFPQFGVREQTKPLGIYNGTDRQTRADDLLLASKQAATVIRAVTIDPAASAAARDALFGAEQQDRWRILRARPGYTVDQLAFVGGIAHKFTRGRWTATVFVVPYAGGAGPYGWPVSPRVSTPR